MVWKCVARKQHSSNSYGLLRWIRFITIQINELGQTHGQLKYNYKDGIEFTWPSEDHNLWVGDMR